jgi:hypothetical protein
MSSSKHIAAHCPLPMPTAHPPPAVGDVPTHLAQMAAMDAGKAPEDGTRRRGPECSTNHDPGDRAVTEASVQ